MLAVLLAGCGQFTDTISLPEEHDEAALYGERAIGQTFTCHHAGLTSISVLLRAPEGSGEVVLHLREGAEGTTDLATATLSPTPGSEAVYHTFQIPLLDDVNGESFYLLLEAPDATAATPVVAPYFSGTSARDDLALDGETVPGHLSYQLHYSSLHIVKDLVRQVSSFGLETVRLLFLSVLFYLLPGGAAVVWLLREGDWLERTIVALGLSVAIYALVMYATMTGLHLGRAATLGFLGLCAALIGLRVWLDWRGGKRWRVPSARAIWASVKQDPSVAVLGFVFALVLGVRIWVTRDLVAPMWGDGYHHTMISQLMVDNRGLFDSWEPYAPLTTFTYHFGFHANVALFHWLSGDTVIHSVIWVGQILNALAVLVLYPLAVKVSGGDRWAGVGAVLVAGLLSPMPMFYVNWSRYTQLAGQVILPVLMWLTWRVTEQPKASWQHIILSGVVLAGLGVTHYRVVLLYAVFCIVLGVYVLVRQWGKWRELWSLGLRVFAIACLGLLLFVPWGLRVFQARIPGIGEYLVQEQGQSQFYRQEYNAIGNIVLYVPWTLLLLALVSVMWLTYCRRLTVWVVASWLGGILALANPGLFGLPGAGIVNNFAVWIMLYIPICILVGALVAGLHVVPWFRKRLVLLIGSTVVVLMMGWGVYQRITDLRLEHAMVTARDLEAMKWIKGNTPASSVFLVDGFAAYGGTTIVGTDAGWWMPLLGARRNTVPPITYGMELADRPNYHQFVNEAFFSLENSRSDRERWPMLLRELGVTHLYVGQLGGRVGNPGQPLLDGEALKAVSGFDLVYHEGNVYVFAMSLSRG